MDNFSEKQCVYDQMRLLIEERRELTKQYYELKERLTLLDDLPKNKAEKPVIDRSEQTIDARSVTTESEYQQYMLSKKSAKKRLSYQSVALTIASILKESGRPLSNKEIYTILTKERKIDVNNKNLTMNILPKMHKDSKLNVERAYRGYWQYRLEKSRIVP